MHYIKRLEINDNVVTLQFPCGQIGLGGEESVGAINPILFH